MQPSSFRIVAHFERGKLRPAKWYLCVMYCSCNRYELLLNLRRDLSCSANLSVSLFSPVENRSQCLIIWKFAYCAIASGNQNKATYLSMVSEWIKNILLINNHEICWSHSHIDKWVILIFVGHVCTKLPIFRYTHVPFKL